MNDSPTTPITLAVVGAGGRGRGYADWALAHPDKARVVAVADPHDERRSALATRHGIDDAHAVTDWRDLLTGEKCAQAVMICTQDAMHVEPAIAFLEAGWDVLLEKPMAPTPEECERIVEAARASEGLFAVCHVLRYTPYTRTLKRLLDEDAIGELMSIEHLEPVGWWHQAHSFVRGNWRREDESSFMLLAKSCHDVDWLAHVMGREITSVSSYGRLSHFRRECQPEGAADRCLQCPLQDTCAYSATRIYLNRFREAQAAGQSTIWPVDAITEDFSEAGIMRALAEGPYGRCVYACDNDVVDHQVVAMEFEGGATGTFTMTAFTEMAFRKTRIFGSQGRIESDGDTIHVLDFRTGQEREVPIDVMGSSDAGGGHGGGDAGLMEAFTTAVATRDASLLLSGAEESLSTHLAVFDAERARRERRVVERA